MLRLAAKGVVGILALLVVALLLLAIRASRARQADVAYHGSLAKTLTVTTRSFHADGEIPPAFTCHGGGNSPQVGWAHAPVGAKSFVMTLVDWDAPTPALRLNVFTHWILYDIPAAASGIGASETNAELRREGVEIGENSAGDNGYAPPCPVFGKHRYTLRVYALDVAKLQPAGLDLQAIQNAMRAHIIAFGETDGNAGN